MDDFISEIRNSINNPKIDSEDFLAMNKNYPPLNIDAKNFHEIKKDSNISSSLLFVDGGNAAIFESADFCLGFIRVYALHYSNNVRISRHIKEFYIFVKEENSKLSVKTFPANDFDGLIFDPEDASLRIGQERSSCSRIISVIRRFAEIEFAYQNDSEETKYIFMDGNLEERYPNESNYATKLFLTGKVCSLSKTCSLTTNSGISITKKLLDMKDGSWYYFPSVTNNNPLHRADIYFARLNNASKYVFRIDVQQGFRDGMEDLFSAIAANSNDAIFPGYPYGLIDADMNARISDEEKKMLQTRFGIKLGKSWNEVSKHLNSMNAHEILDKIRF